MQAIHMANIAENAATDLSFHATDDWVPYLAGGAKVNMLAFGDDEKGPLVILLSMPPFGKPIDPKTGFGEESVHHHPSDGLRLILGGDFMVGRELYRPGDARLQAGGEFYGPEAFGPVVSQGDTPCWLMIAFLDRQGAGMFVADAAGQERSDAIEAHMLPLYERMGVSRPLGRSDGYSTLSSSSGGKLRQGRFNLSAESTDKWEDFEDFQASLYLGGQREIGPVVVTISAKPGAIALPPGALGPETLLVVAKGSVSDDGGQSLTVGDLRMFAKDSALSRLTAGPDGAGLYLLIGNRAEIDPRPDVGDALARDWSRWIMATVKALRSATPNRLAEPAI